MSGNRIEVNLSVEDKGGTVNKRTRDTKELNQELTRAADLSKKAQAVGARYQAAQSNQEYNRGRGAMGSTGASARDFAQEAQGLGGLVRIYATVAANLFAVTAAFGALKEAANTTNMVKGMNQLGAVSGMALGSLSQRFVEATDGAISLREAMGAVTKASAAGLSGKQILEVAKIAKTASQALGIDMTDAVSRLSRGITKLEPELLDELGLFTKIGPATEAYAASIGKSAASLTDFERRQAFANAVLKEGRDKFGEIELDANPYQKLEASIRNLATAGLELINKFLIPLVTVFTNNTPLLIGALGFFAGKLVNMAIPALTSWRDELVKSAKTAKDKAKEINESFASKNVESTLAKFNLPELQKNLDQAKTQYAKAAKDIDDIQKNQGLRSTKTTQAMQAGTYGNDPKDFARTQAQINDLSKKGTQEAAAYADALQRGKQSKKDILELTKQISSAENQAEQQFQKSNMEEAMRKRISQRAGARAERLDILSNVGGNLQAGGWTYAISELDKGLNKAVDLKGWDRLRTRATGWAIAGASQIGMFVNSLGKLGAALAVAGTVIAVIDAMFGKNAAQAAEFDSAAKSLTSTIETSNNVLKKYGDTITVASLSAKANNFRELGDNIDDLTARLERAVEKQSGWDYFKDRFYSIFNFDIGTEFADKAAAGITQQLKMIPEGPIRDELVAKIRAITGAGEATEEDIAKALRAKNKKDSAKAVESVNKAFDKPRMSALALADASKEVDSALKNANTRLQAVFQSLAVTDPFALFGQSLVELGLKLQIAAKETESTGASIKKLLDNTENRKIINPENFAQLLNLNDQFDKASVAVRDYEGQLNSTQQRIDDLKKSISRGGGGVGELQQELMKQEVKRDELKVKLSVDKSSINDIQAEINRISKETIRSGYDIIFKTANLALEKAQVATQKYLISGTTSAGAAAANTSLNLQDISIQQRQLTATSTLSDNMFRNNVLLEMQIADKEAEKIKAAAASEGRGLNAKQAQEVSDLETRRDELQRLSGLKRISQKDAQSFTDPKAQMLASEGVMKQLGTQAQQQQLAEQARLAKIQGIVAVKTAELNTEMELRKAKQVLLELDSKILDLSLTGLAYLTDEELARKNIVETNKLAEQQSMAKKAIENEILVLAQKSAYADAATLKGLVAEINLKETQLGLLDKQAPKEQLILSIQQRQAAVTNMYAQRNKLIDNSNELTSLGNDLTAGGLQSELELFQQRMTNLGVDRDLYAQKEKSMRLQILDQQAQSDTFKVGQEFAKKLRKIEEDKQKALAADSAANIERYEEDAAFAGSVVDLQLEKIKQSTAAKKAGLELDYQITNQMRAYDQIFRNSIDGMADALVNFVKTGKLDFKSLVDSMIADLLRFELRRQMTMMYDASGGFSGIMNMITGATSTSTYSPTGGMEEHVFNPGRNAKGNVYDVGLMKFAKGGTFTNSVVSQPTMFKFAQGAGLMGEAGPEAIMPLKRDNHGNLGVRSDNMGTKVDIVVNNFSGEKTETKETVDSKGNRKIEVMVGDMVADQLSKPGSSTQQALTNGFGQRPSVVRR